MKKTSYKFRFISLISLLLLLIIVGFYNFTATISLSDVGNISKANFKNKALEREIFVEDFFNTYISTLKAVNQDTNFKNYLEAKLDKTVIENYFLSIKKSLTCLTAISYINSDFQELVKVYGTPLFLFGDKAVSNVLSEAELKDLKNKEDIKTFFKLEKDEIGFSNLKNENHSFSQKRKRPTFKIAMKVYDNSGIEKGIVVLNICLRTFFKTLDKTTLYNIYLINKNGEYLNHNDPKYGLLGEDSSYSIKDEYPDIWKEILSNDEYFGMDFFTYKMDFFKNKDIRMILELKFHEQSNNTSNKEKDFVFYLIVFLIVLIIIFAYMSKLPDKLKNEIKDKHFRNSITNLPNVNELKDDFENQKFNNSLLILISVNNIRKIQNSYSQKLVDRLMKDMASYLKEYKEDNLQKIYFLRQDVFAIRYDYPGYDKLIVFINKLISDIETYEFKIREGDLKFSLEVCIGISSIKNILNNENQLIQAENALYNALQNNLSFDIFDEKHLKSVESGKHNILLSNEIKKAIEEKEIFLEYQAIKNNVTNEIEKYESLVRIKHNDKTIYPNEFLGISKEIKKYRYVTKAVIDQSFEFFKDKDIEFSINISILDISDENFVKYLISKLEEYKIGFKLVLEIVEQEGVENYEEFFSFMKKMKEYDCKIAIDDFGSGYSNLEYILKMSDYIDYLKIDGSFIKNLQTDKKSMILIQSLVFLCSKLNIKTIAEYVENEEIQKIVESLCIDYSQGYYLGKPKVELH